MVRHLPLPAGAKKEPECGVTHSGSFHGRKGKKSFSVDTVWKISVALNIDPGKLFEIDMDELIRQ